MKYSSIFLILLGFSSLAFTHEIVDALKPIFAEPTVANMAYPSVVKLKRLAASRGIAAEDEHIEEAWFDVFKRHSEKLPTHYLHRTLARQRAVYREVFTEIIGGSGSTLRLFPILQNAFALIHDYVDKQRNNSRYSDSLFALHNLWRQARATKTQLTNWEFQRLNAKLALIVDYFKGNLDSLDESKLTKKLEVFETLNIPIFIIYGNPDASTARNVSQTNFVDEICHHSFPGYLSYFDILSMKTDTPTKKDPHWSSENGTLKFLIHDFDHNLRQYKVIIETGTLDFIRALCDVRKSYEIDGKPTNESTIIGNGIFFTTHEAPHSLRKALLNQEDNHSLVKTLAEIHYEEDLYKLIAKWFPYASKEYKKEPRDHEILLRQARDENGGLYLPLIPYERNGDELLRRPFPFAFYKEKPTELIVVIPAMVKETRLQFESSDSLLTYLPKAQQSVKHIPSHFVNRDKAIKQRNGLMHNTLIDGFKRYWSHFVKLAQDRL